MKAMGIFKLPAVNGFSRCRYFLFHWNQRNCTRQKQVFSGGDNRLGLSLQIIDYVYFTRKLIGDAYSELQQLLYIFCREFQKELFHWPG
jgi:hypothetical protein